MSPPVLSASIAGIGFWTRGLPSWEAACAYLADGQLPEAPANRPSPQLLAANERRRAPETVAVALEVALAACTAAGRDPATLASVFTSTHGDLSITDYMCETLASAPLTLSPTRFHNSVHNAASGYWSIATGATPAAQVLGAYDASVAAGLLEAITQVHASGAPVLLVAADSEYPEPLHAKRPIQDTSAFALLLAPAQGPRSLGRLLLPRQGALRDTAGDLTDLPSALAALVDAMPPMRGLPLLAALAGGAARHVALPYWPPQWLWLDVAPA